MIRDITEKPVHPINGDRYQNKAGDEFVFRFGSWIKQDDS